MTRRAGRSPRWRRNTNAGFSRKPCCGSGRQPAPGSSEGGAMAEEILLWRRLDGVGHECARLVYHEPFWQLGGTAVFGTDGKACRLEYSVACDAAWRTLHVDVGGWIGPRRIRFNLVANPQRVWHLDGRPCPEV